MMSSLVNVKPSVREDELTKMTQFAEDFGQDA